MRAATWSVDPDGMEVAAGVASDGTPGGGCGDAAGPGDAGIGDHRSSLSAFTLRPAKMCAAMRTPSE